MVYDRQEGRPRMHRGRPLLAGRRYTSLHISRVSFERQASFGVCLRSGSDPISSGPYGRWRVVKSRTLARASALASRLLVRKRAHSEAAGIASGFQDLLSRPRLRFCYPAGGVVARTQDGAGSGSHGLQRAATQYATLVAVLMKAVRQLRVCASNGRTLQQALHSFSANHSVPVAWHPTAAYARLKHAVAASDRCPGQ